jgi:hypothetical protein
MDLGKPGVPKLTHGQSDAPPSGIIKPGVVQTFRVLNADCNVSYEPVRDYVFRQMGCGPDPQITG